METSKEVALTICEKIQNEYPKRPLWQTMLEIEDLIDKHVAKQLIIHGVINWLPFVRENYPEFDKLTREKNCLCLYDDGTEIDFEKESHPMAIMTHFKAKT